MPGSSSLGERAIDLHPMIVVTGWIEINGKDDGVSLHQGLALVVRDIYQRTKIDAFYKGHLRIFDPPVLKQILDIQKREIVWLLIQHLGISSADHFHVSGIESGGLPDEAHHKT